MSLPDAARKSLDYLQSTFEANAKSSPNFKHMLIDTPDIEAFNEAVIAVPFVFGTTNRQIQIFSRHNREMQVFFDANYDRGKEAYEAFWPLAEDAVETLAAWGLLRPEDPLPDPLEPEFFEIKKSHYSKQWMVFVHRFAKAHPGALPRSAPAPCVEHLRLKKGGMAHSLTPGIFKSSSLVLERILTDPIEHAVDIADDDIDLIPDPATLNLGELRRLLWDVDKLHEKAGMKGREWQGRYPPKIHRAIIRREHCMNQGAGFNELKSYLNIELGKYVTIEAMDELIRLVAKRLRKPFDEIHQLTLVNALAILNEPAPPAPFGAMSSPGSDADVAQNPPKRQGPSITQREWDVMRWSSGAAPMPDGRWVSPEGVQDTVADPAAASRDDAKTATPSDSVGTTPKPQSNDNTVEKTATMLGKATGQIKLIHFLATRDTRSADLKEIDRSMYQRHAARKQNLRNVRRQAEKTRDNLAAKGCPLRPHISGNVVRLMDAEPAA